LVVLETKDLKEHWICVRSAEFGHGIAIVFEKQQKEYFDHAVRSIARRVSVDGS
jgi:hypothetical protein